DHLRVGPVQDAAHRHPRRLRLVRHDADLLAADRVEEGGLADVGPSGQRDEAGPERHFDATAPWDSCRPGTGATRTRAMRWPSIRSAVKRWPRNSTLSPSWGTCPSVPNTNPPTVPH